VLARFVCDNQRHFSFVDVAKVIADASHRAYFRNSKTYLVADNLVELAAQQREDTDAVCVQYRRDATHEVVGWLPKKVVQPIDDTVLQERANKTIDRKAWIGTWKNEQGELEIKALTENQLTVNGNVNEGTYGGL
jgi:hypothetical protein